MALRTPFPSAHLGLGIVEDVGGLLAEAGHHFLDGRGGAADLLCQSGCLLLSPLLADDGSRGQRGATLEEKADSGPRVQIAFSLLGPETSGRVGHAPSSTRGSPRPFLKTPAGAWDVRPDQYHPHVCDLERVSPSASASSPVK